MVQVLEALFGSGTRANSARTPWQKGRSTAQLASTPELIEDVAGTFRQLRRYAAHDQTGRSRGYEESAELACTEAREHGNCLVIVNTRNAARAIFEHCRQLLPADVYLAHLSTVMCPAHCTVVPEELKRRLADENGPPAGRPFV